MPPVKMRGVQRPKNTAKTIRRLLGYMGAFKFLWPLVFFFVLLEAGAEVYGTYLIRPAVNDYIVPYIGHQNPSLGAFFDLCIKLAMVYLAGSISTYIVHRFLLYISTSTLFNIRRELFDHVSKLPLKYYDTRNHGILMSLYTNDTDTLRDMFSQSIPQLLTGMVQVTGVFCMMIYLSIPLTVVMIITIAIMLVIGARIGKLSQNAYRSQQANIGAVNGYIEELIEGQKIVKIFTRETETEKQFQELNEKLCQAGTRASTFASILGPVMNNFSHLQYTLVAVTGAILVIRGAMDLGTIASFLHSTRSFSRPLSQLSQQFNAILNALAGAERIFAAIDEDPETDEGQVILVNATEVDSKFSRDGDIHLVQSFARTGTWGWKTPGLNTLKKLAGDIVFTDVNFSYDGQVKVLNNINLHAKPGQKIALVGSTGSGKTTITNLLTRFYDLDAGCGMITYDGIPINDIRKSDLRQSMAMVLQDTHLFSGTIMENIRYGKLEATDRQVYKAAELVNADSFIRHLPEGYNTQITGDGTNLSQGQRQLLAIARAAIADPPVLILDEATSSIDTRTETLIEKGMDTLMEGRTVFVIAHRLSTVRNADLIVVLEHGSIIEQGTHQELLQLQGRYYQLYNGAFQLD